MSLAGLKKQFNKANQFMNEKIGGAKGTELDNEFCEMEKKIDVLAKLVDDIINKTHEFLQPNPASRARMLTLNTLSKIRGQVNVRMYPQPEGSLGDYMIKHGNDLGQDCLFGQSLVETGESYKHLAEIKYNLEDAVKQNFIDPLTQLQNKDLKEVNHYLKKMSGRRLDFDCKSRKREKGSGILDEEVRIAEKKFEESRDSAENAMQNLLNSEQEHIAQLIAFVSAQSDFHKQALDTLNSLLGTLETKRVEASSKSHSSHISKSVNCLKEIRAQPKQDDAYSTFDMSCVRKNGDGHPFARALYTFEPESEGELGFGEGDIIGLISQLDENWFEGCIHGKVGYFPINYVKVLVPIPHSCCS